MENGLVIDAATLVEQKNREVAWLLDGVIPAGGLVLLAGETSSGKGFLGLELALGVASRGRAWELACGVRGKVRYLCADADGGELARRVGRLCRGYGIEVPKTLEFDFGRHVFDDTHVDTLEKIIGQEGYQLVIVDPLSRYLPWMNDNSMRSVGVGLQAMRELAKKTGATVVMLQGFNKLPKRPLSKWGEPITDGTERVRGSTELVASCDTTLLVTRGRTRNMIELVKNRQGRTRWISYFSVVDGPSTPYLTGGPEEGNGPSPDTCLPPRGVGAGLHIVFEKAKGSEIRPPVTLAELVERRIKKVMRRRPEREFARTELIEETEKLVGKVGKRACAEAFALLGKDSEVKVDRGEKNRKTYRLAEPVKAFFDMIAEEEGELAALDLVGKKVAVEAPIRLLEKQMAEMEESKKEGGALEALIKRIVEEGAPK